MPLTAAQKTALLADIAANTATVTYQGVAVQINQIGTAGKPAKAGDTAHLVAEWYNGAASPAFTFWRPLVPLAQIATKINGTELAGLTTANVSRLDLIITLISAASGLNASLADQRQFFDDVFSGAGGTVTRAALLALWKALATRAQKLFSTGTGSDASPATLASNIGEAFALGDDELNGIWLP